MTPLKILPIRMQKAFAMFLTPFASFGQCLMFALLATLVLWLAQGLYPKFAAPLSWDSFGYIEFHAFRSGLYPAFLRLFGDATLHNYQPILDRIIATHLTIHLLAVGFMLWALARVRMPIAVLVIFFLALLGNYQSQAYHNIIRTESLGYSMVCFIIAGLALWFHSRQYRWLALAMTAGMLIFGMRPNSLPLPFGIIIVALCHIAYTAWRARGAWRATIKPIAKALAAVMLPLIIVGGFEHAYYHAHHTQRSQRLLETHLFGKAVIVLATQDDEQLSRDDEQWYSDDLKPFMQRHRELFQADRDRYGGRGEVCLWLTMHAIYEDSIYAKAHNEGLTVAPLEWTLGVFATYPATTARIIAQHYLNFFCVSRIAIADPPVLGNEFLRPDLTTKPFGRGKLIFRTLVAWAFVGLGIGFFISKAWYATLWVRRSLAFVSSRFTAPAPLTPLEALGSGCIMLAFGFNLFICIFGVPYLRFLATSYPFIVLGVLLMMVMIAMRLTSHKPNYATHSATHPAIKE
ncbi:MAG: hypothetical protein MJE68_22740 [Proteobacteria bacterium]|nr:hypothetical protein [Pseudomonadota bacterium]